MKTIEFSQFFEKEQPITKLPLREPATCKIKSRVAEILPMILEGNNRIAVTNDEQHFYGLVTSMDVLDFLGGGEKYNKFLSGRLGTPVDRIAETKMHTITPKHTIGNVLSHMRKRNVDTYPLLVGKKLSALVSEKDFVHRLHGKTGIMVKDAMVHKPMVVKDHMSLVDVANIMVRARYRRLPVVSKGVLIGIVTPFDIINYLKSRNMLHDLKAQTLPITEVMNKNVVTVGLNDDLAVAIDKMKSGHSCLPVVDENELLGIITERDIIEALV